MSKISNKLNTTQKNNCCLNNANQILKNVDHPAHYQSKSGIEAIDVIEAFDLGFNLGNVVKYILRCGKKDADVQELEKAKWYLEREIKNRQHN